MPHLTTFSSDSHEYRILNATAIMLSDLDPEKYHYYVDTCYFDAGQGWLYTTIIKENLDEHPNSVLRTCQALCPRDQNILIDEGMAGIYNNVMNYHKNGHMHNSQTM